MAKAELNFGELGGGTKDLLWTNSGNTCPASVQLNGLSNYDYLLFHISAGQDGAITDCIVNPSDSSSQLALLARAGAYFMIRIIFISGDTVTFEQTSYEHQIGGTGKWSNNTYCVPLEIYGVKF